MKKRIIITSIVTVVIFISIIGMGYNDSNNTYTQDGVIYALTLNGASTNTFPSKGMYRVDVNCENATGKWLYDEWKLAIEDITSDNITCDIDFTTISQTNLNNYIIGLSGTTQGTGQLVHETFDVPDYTSATTLTQAQYGTPTMYSSRWDFATSGTATTGTFIYSGDEWNSVPSEMTSGTYYHFMFTPEESGYYQICYNVSAGNKFNELYTYVNTLRIISNISASTSITQSGCQNLGYVSTDDSIRIVQGAYSDSSYGIATMSFSIEKANIVNEVDTGYRYEGKNPNNYIWFNNELWRIIGVFDSASHGQAGQNLVKIIRNDSIGALTWNKNNTNDWTQASLMNLLNGAYLNSENGTGGEYCYGYSTTVPANCDYRETGINDTYRPMIENATWYLGGHSIQQISADEFYDYERGTAVYSGMPTEWEGYIGLMYPSDFVYAGGFNGWMSIANAEWTITPVSSNSTNIFSTNEGYGPINANVDVENGNSVRPVLYLDTSVYVIDGNGSISDPYIIGI